MRPQSPVWTAAVLGVIAAGCFDSHDVRCHSVAGDRGEDTTELEPAPGEGSVCHELAPTPPGCPVGAGDGLCDAGELASRLAGARPGEVVLMGRCCISGAFRVPAGVTLSGIDPVDSVIEVGAGETGITLEAGEQPAAARCLTIESEGAAGVVVHGEGDADVSRVTMHLTRGIGLEAENVRRLRLHALRIEGSVTLENAVSLPPDPTATDTATHGIALVNVREASLSDVHADRLARFGVVAMDSVVTWRGGGTDQTLGTGVMVAAGRACVRGLSSTSTLQGARLIPAYGLVVSAGAEVEADEVVLSQSEGLGLLLDHASIHLARVTAAGNQSGAIWAQNAARFVLEGSTVSDNDAAGVVLCHADDAEIRDTTIATTHTVTRVSSEAGRVEVGLGLAIEYAASVRLSRVDLVDNVQAGALVDLGIDDVPDVTFEHVRVDADPRTSHGVLGYLREPRRDAPLGWDDGVERTPEMTARDRVGVAEIPVFPGCAPAR